MGKTIGIDLGTTNSVVAVMEGGDPTVITNPENTVYSIKRFMGRRFDEVNEEQKMVAYPVKKSSAGVTITAGGKEYSPQEISAMILTKLKEAAEAHLGQKVTEAVITVPA